MFRILAIGDPHFRVDNLDESKTFTAELQAFLKKRANDLDLIIVLGDILHTHEKLHTVALNMACQFFKLLTSFFPVYCLVGNHDATSNTIFLSDNHWLNALKQWKNLTVVDKPLKLEKDSCSICLCPYVPEGRFTEALDTLGRTAWATADCVFGHQGLDGAKMGAIVMQNVEEWRDEYPQLISGHIHDKQWVKKNLYYTGSSMQHAFGESEDKSLALVQVRKSKQVSIEELYLSIKRKKILYLDVDNLESQVKKAMERIESDDNTEFKIVVKGSQEELKTFKKSKDYKELEKVSKKIQLKTTIEPVALSEPSENQEEAKFVDILFGMVDGLSDPYASSFLRSVVSGSEDISDKDVLVLKK